MISRYGGTPVTKTADPFESVSACDFSERDDLRSESPATDIEGEIPAPVVPGTARR